MAEPSTSEPQLDASAAAPPPALPGFGASSACWKCKGAGTRLKPKMGARQRKRMAEGAEDDGSCGVCGGSGVAPRSGKLSKAAKKPGRVTAPRSEASTRRGPRPAGVGAPGPGEELCCLSGAWRVFQRVGGHRYSTEDVVTAWVASGEVAGGAVRHVDVGCGIGSVLQLVAWKCLEAGVDYEGRGVEAQVDSANLARRSIAYNGAPCAVVDGDLRDARAFDELHEGCEAAQRIVTGTPPYFNVAFDGAGAASTNFGAFPNCEQSAGARYEFRGGVEAYCDAGARLLRGGAPGDRFVCCEGGLHVNLARVAAAAKANGLVILRHLPVVGREGKPPLFGVWVLRLAAPGDDAAAAVAPDAPLVVRDAQGARTPAYARVLADLAMV